MAMKDMFSMIKNVEKLKSDMEAELRNIEISGESGAGSVKVEGNATPEIRKLVIDDTMLEESKSLVETLIVSAINDALRKAAEAKTAAEQRAMQSGISDIMKNFGNQ